MDPHGIDDGKLWVWTGRIFPLTSVANAGARSSAVAPRRDWVWPGPYPSGNGSDGPRRPRALVHAAQVTSGRDPGVAAVAVEHHRGDAAGSHLFGRIMGYLLRVTSRRAEDVLIEAWLVVRNGPWPRFGHTSIGAQVSLRKRSLVAGSGGDLSSPCGWLGRIP